MFQGKIVAITGASSGIGRQLSYDFAELKATVILISRNRKKLEKTSRYVKSISPESSYFACDVSNKSQVNKTFKKIISKYKKVDILINNAGFGIYKNFIDTTIKDFEDQMNVNFYGTLYCIKAVLPSMLKSKGHIVNIASIAGKTSLPHISAYSTSKFAVAGFTESLYYDLRKKGIKVTLVCPGATKTNFFSHPTFKNFPHSTRHKNMMDPSYVSKEIIESIRKNKFELILPPLNRYKMYGKIILSPIARKAIEKLPR